MSVGGVINSPLIEMPRVANEPLKEKEKKETKKSGITFKGAVGELKDAAGVVKVTKASTGIAEQFTSIPGVFEEIFKWVKVVKILKGVIAIKKVYSNIKDFFVADTAAGKISATWGLYKAAKHITEAAIAAMKYLRDFGVINKDVLAWSVIAGYVFLPMKIIATCLSSYHLGQKIALHTTFKDNTKCSKKDDVDVRIAKMVKAMTFVRKEGNELLRMGVITKDCPLKARTDSILDRLRASNKEMRVKAALEGKVLIRNLKDRISAQMVSNGIDTVIRGTALTTVLLGLTNPITALPSAIIGLGLVVVAVANGTFSKFIPTGDFYEDEKPMLYARAFNAVRSAGKFVVSGISKVAGVVQVPFRVLGSSLAHSNCQKAT